MEERSKTNKEIFELKYPAKLLKQNSLICAEAIGYLKALIQYFPSEQEWVNIKISELLLTVLYLIRDWGTNMWQEFSIGLTTNISEVMKIIDDALCYNFEFKVENHKLYFREVA